MKKMYCPNKSNQLKHTVCFFLMVITTSFFLPFYTNAQNTTTSLPKDTLILAAREIIKATPFCALVTVDSVGQPQVRTMNPFPLGDDLVIWFATSRTSRKVKEIKHDPKVCVYFADHTKATGYVCIAGTAEVIDDKNLLLKKKRAYWEGIPGWQEKFVLIKITPVKMDVINYNHNVNGDSETFKSPTVEF